LKEKIDWLYLSKKQQQNEKGREKKQKTRRQMSQHLPCFWMAKKVGAAQNDLNGERTGTSPGQPECVFEGWFRCCNRALHEKTLERAKKRRINARGGKGGGRAAASGTYVRPKNLMRVRC